MSLKFDNGERESIIDFNVHDISDANNNEITHVVKVSVYIIERWKLTIFHFQKEFLQNHNSSNYFSKDIDTNYEIHNNANEGSYSSENQLNEDPNISNSKKSSIKVSLYSRVYFTAMSLTSRTKKTIYLWFLLYDLSF